MTAAPCPGLKFTGEGFHRNWGQACGDCRLLAPPLLLGRSGIWAALGLSIDQRSRYSSLGVVLLRSTATLSVCGSMDALTKKPHSTRCLKASLSLTRNIPM